MNTRYGFVLATSAICALAACGKTEVDSEAPPQASPMASSATTPTSMTSTDSPLEGHMLMQKLTPSESAQLNEMINHGGNSAVHVSAPNSKLEFSRAPNGSVDEKSEIPVSVSDADPAKPPHRVKLSPQAAAVLRERQ